MMCNLEEQGFELIPDVVEPATLHSLVDALSDPSLRRSRAGIRSVLQIKAVRELASSERLMQLAQGVVGAGAFPFRATLFDKSPQSNWLVVWHQDTALPLRERMDVTGWGPWSRKDGVTYAHAPASALQQVLAIRVHLDNSNEDNGPLRVLPGTHRYNVLSDDAVCDIATRTSAIECCVPSGGVLLMRPLLVHASSKARANGKPRRVLHIEYSSTKSFAGGLELAVCKNLEKSSARGSAEMKIPTLTTPR